VPPWEDARNILVAIKPDANPNCAFAQLPIELVHYIIFLLVDVRYGIAHYSVGGHERQVLSPSMQGMFDVRLH
jgi:hypothetical protein